MNVNNYTKNHSIFKGETNMPQNIPSDRSSVRPYPPMSPTAPFFPRHFYPMGYMGDLFIYPELGRPIPDSKEVRPSWPFTLISLSVYLLLGLLFLTLILWSNRQSAPELTKPAAPEVHRILASYEAIPHPPYTTCVGVNPPRSQRGKPTGIYPTGSLSVAPQQRGLCQWFGLDRV
jgi:hypothetical protein